MARWFAVLTGIAVLGVVLAVPPPAVATDDAVQRLAGTTRIDTAVAVSEATFTSADTALLARADTYPDALTGTVLAHQQQAPLLLTDRDGVLDAVKAELERLGVERVILLGGTAAISNAVRDELATEYRVSRVAGSSRWATAVEVAEVVDASPDTVILATGETFPDAVAVSAYAAHQDWPILLTTKDALPTEVADYLETAGPVRIVPVGGPAAVSDAVLSGLEAEGHTVADRLAGPTRWATSHRIATAHADALGSPTALWVATGEAFPDALTAGVAAAARGALLQLTPTATLDIPATTADVQARLVHERACDGSGPLTDVVLTGGLGALTDTVRLQAWTTMACMQAPGGRIVYARDSGVWAAEPSGARAHLLIPGSGRDTTYAPPTLSPTGTHVVAEASMDGSVRLTVADLRTERVTVAVNGSDAVWSPDGTRVAFVQRPDRQDQDYWGYDIMVVRADGSGLTQLVADRAADENMPFGWSSDRREVFFRLTQDDVSAPSHLKAVDVVSGDVRHLTSPDYPRFDEAATVSPDGTRLAFVRTDRNETPDLDDQLIVLDVATGDEQVMLEAANLRGSRPRWAPDGTSLAVSTGEHIVRVNLATGTTEPVGDVSGSVVSWSPDGGRLLVRQERWEKLAQPPWSRAYARLLAVTVRTGDALALTDDSGVAGTAVWSPDGDWVLYQSDPDGDGPATTNLFLTRSDATTEAFRITDQGATSPAWTAAGQAP